MISGPELLRQLQDAMSVARPILEAAQASEIAFQVWSPFVRTVPLFFTPDDAAKSLYSCKCACVSVRVCPCICVCLCVFPQRFVP